MTHDPDMIPTLQKGQVGRYLLLPKGDPLWPNVVLLIQDGEVVDKSKYARALTTAAGTITEHEALASPGGESVLIYGSLGSSGSPDYIRTSGFTWAFNAGTTPELVFGTDDICIETFFRFNGGSSKQVLYTDGYGWNSSGILFAVTPSTGLIEFNINNVGPGVYATQSALVQDTLYHLAVQKIGTLVKLYIDGVGHTLVGYSGLGGDEAPASINDPLGPTTSPPGIGGQGGTEGSEDFNIEQYRITVGAARYTGDFDVPSALFPIG